MDKNYEKSRKVRHAFLGKATELLHSDSLYIQIVCTIVDQNIMVGKLGSRFLCGDILTALILTTNFIVTFFAGDAGVMQLSQVFMSANKTSVLHTLGLR